MINPAVSELRNLGPASAKMLATAGWLDSEALLAADPVEVFYSVQQQGIDPSLNLLYAIVGAQSGQDWRQVMRERGGALQLQLESLIDAELGSGE